MIANLLSQDDWRIRSGVIFNLLLMQDLKPNGNDKVS